MERDTERSIPAGDEPPDIRREMGLEAILGEPPHRRRLQDERRVCRGDIADDCFTPAPVVRDLEDIAAEIDLAARVHRREPCGRLRLDVPREQETRPFHALPGIDLDRQHERKVVVAPRSVSLARPQHGPSGAAEPHAVAGLDHLELDSARPHRLEQLRDGGVRALGGKKGVVDHDALDARISRHIRKRAQVVEVGVRDEDRIDDTAARVDPREQRPCRDIPDRARASIEQDERFT